MTSLTLERTLGDDAWRLPSAVTHIDATDDPRLVRVVSERSGRSLVSLVDVITGRTLTERMFTTERVSRVTTSRDGSTLALAYYNGAVTVWDARAGVMLRAVDDVADTSIVPWCAFDARGTRLLVWNTSRAAERRGVFVFDTRTGERLLRAPVEGQAALSADGMTLIGGVEHPRRVTSWDLSGDEPEALYSVATRGWAWQYAITHDGDVIFGTSEGEVRRWSPREGVTRWVRDDLQHGIRALCADADGRWVALTVGYDAGATALHLLDGRTGETVRKLPCRELHLLAITPDGSRLVTAEPGQLAVFDLPRGDRRDQLEGHAGPITALAFALDASFIASAAQDGVRVWSFVGNDTRWTFEPPAEVMSLAATADGRALVAQCGAHDVVAWDLATGSELARTTSPRFDVPLCVSPDARYVLWATAQTHDDGDEARFGTSLHVWDLARPEPFSINDRPRADGRVLRVGVTRDGRYAVVFTEGKPWRVDLAKLRRAGRGRVPGRGRLVAADLANDVAVGLWSLDEEALDAGENTNETREVNTWNTETGSLTSRPWRVSRAWLVSSSHGSPPLLASRLSRESATLELTDAVTREPLGAIDAGAEGDVITCLAVSPGGSRIAAGTDRGLVRVFRRWP